MKRCWIVGLLLATSYVHGQSCYTTSVLSPTPLMGNSGEVFRTADGALFQVVGSYEYLYEYFPSVQICPGAGRMLVAGKQIGIVRVGNSAARDPRAGRDMPSPPLRAGADITVVLRVRGCDYFLANGRQGYYLLEWYGGHDPDQGDGILNELATYGFKDVLYSSGQNGRVYVDDYWLSKDSALEKLRNKCR